MSNFTATSTRKMFTLQGTYTMTLGDVTKQVTCPIQTREGVKVFTIIQAKRLAKAWQQTMEAANGIEFNGVKFIAL